MFRNRVGDPKHLINMGETAMYLNRNTTRTVHSTNIEGATSSRFTLNVSIALDGTKRPCFVTFNGERGGKIEKFLNQIVPAGIIACVPAKGSMGNHTGILVQQAVPPIH